MLTLLILFAVGCRSQEGPIVETTYGRIRGGLDNTESGSVYERFLGIPYATPPTGSRRFTQPTPPLPWQGTLETTSFANGCIQTTNVTDTSEECLYMNIYVPGQNRSGADLAVMVFIHGGVYFYGTASTYPSEDLAEHGDVIVATINYRLGALGFLSTEDDAAPGNWGLWDVKLALEWVRDNIAAFGGSPDRVTVFGQSAGGAITSHVMISPQTQGLLQRGICISGTSSSLAFGTAYAGSLSVNTKLVGQQLGCPDLNNSYALVDCLRGVDPFDLNFWGLWSPLLPGAESMYFMPVVDGEFVPQHPSLTWNQTLTSDLDLITGSVLNDAATSVLVQPQENPNTTINCAATKESTARLLGYNFDHFPGNDTDVIAAVIEQYPGIDDNNTDIRTQSMSEMFTDFMFASGPHFEASHHSLYPGTTYVYKYAYTQSFLKPYIPEEYNWLVAEHLDDLWSVFGEQLVKDYVADVLKGEFSEADKSMSKQVMSYYTNFANTGNPNDGVDVDVLWPQFSRESREYLEFSEETKVLVETETELDNYRFWTKEFPLVAFPDQTLLEHVNG